MRLKVVIASCISEVQSNHEDHDYVATFQCFVILSSIVYQPMNYEMTMLHCTVMALSARPNVYLRCVHTVTIGVRLRGGGVGVGRVIARKLFWVVYRS